MKLIYMLVVPPPPCGHHEKLIQRGLYYSSLLPHCMVCQQITVVTTCASDRILLTVLSLCHPHPPRTHTHTLPPPCDKNHETASIRSGYRLFYSRFFGMSVTGFLFFFLFLFLPERSDSFSDFKVRTLVFLKNSALPSAVMCSVDFFFFGAFSLFFFADD